MRLPRAKGREALSHSAQSARKCIVTNRFETFRMKICTFQMGHSAVCCHRLKSPVCYRRMITLPGDSANQPVVTA